MQRPAGHIIQYEHPTLRAIAAPVKVTDITSPAIKKVIATMIRELKTQDDGVAIAAPQIGESLRIFVVSRKVFALRKDGTPLEGDELPEEHMFPENDLVCINPKIIRVSKKRHWVPEGCLSVRWLYGETNRAEKATIEAYDERGKKFVRGASGLLAQIFQHETDHLNGILFVDHARNVEDVPPEEMEKARKRRT